MCIVDLASYIYSTRECMCMYNVRLEVAMFICRNALLAFRYVVLPKVVATSITTQIHYTHLRASIYLTLAKISEIGPNHLHPVLLDWDFYVYLS